MEYARRCCIVGGMKLSFVIPAYNEEAALPKCLESVMAEISANNLKLGEDIEVVVVNNASTDKTKEVAQKFHGVRVVDEPHKGMVRARKAGFDASAGELVANIDADTLVPRGWLKKVLTEFDGDKHLVAMTGPYIYYDLNVWGRALVKMWYFPGWLLHIVAEPLGHAVMLQGGNFVLRRSAWDGVGGFDPTIEFYGEDADVARRIRKKGRVLWSWGLPMYTTARRLKAEGFLKTGWYYGLNIVATHITGRPYTDRYTDVRQSQNII